MKKLRCIPHLRNTIYKNVESLMIGKAEPVKVPLFLSLSEPTGPTGATEPTAKAFNQPIQITPQWPQ